MFKSIRKIIATAGASFMLALVPALGLTATVAAADTNPPTIGACLSQGSGLTATTADTACQPTNTEDGAAQIQGIVTTIVNIFSVVVGVVAVIMIIVGGFKYITSGGDSGNITGAKNTIVYAVIGLVIVALSQFIVQFVLTKVNSTP